MTQPIRPERPQKRSIEAREILLDAAERLFAERGYFGASVRDITDAAGMRLASVNYHFGSKETLLAEVVRRRAAVLREDRLASLEAALAAPGGRGDRLTAIVAAFVEPMIARCLVGGEGWRRFFVLLAQINALPFNAPRGQIDDFDDVALAYIAAFRGLSPRVSLFQAHATFQFMIGVALFVVCDNRRLDHLSDGRFRSGDLASLTGPLVAFLSHGAPPPWA